MFTAVVIFGAILYFLGWRKGQEQRASEAANTGISTPVADVHPHTNEAARRHQPESGGPPTSSWDHNSTPVLKEEYADLFARNLTAPIAGLRAQDVRDTFNEGRANGKAHEATDIIEPRG